MKQILFRADGAGAALSPTLATVKLAGAEEALTVKASLTSKADVPLTTTVQSGTETGSEAQAEGGHQGGVPTTVKVADETQPATTAAEKLRQTDGMPENAAATAAVQPTVAGMPRPQLELYVRIAAAALTAILIILTIIRIARQK